MWCRKLGSHTKRAQVRFGNPTFPLYFAMGCSSVVGYIPHLTMFLLIFFDAFLMAVQFFPSRAKCYNWVAHRVNQN